MCNAYGNEQLLKPEERKMPIGEKIVLSEIPQNMCGSWKVVLFEDLKGESLSGDQLDVWQIKADSINFGEAGKLQVREVQALIESNQDLHILNFSDNGLQCAFIRSNTFPDTYQVVQYLDGKQKMKCLLTQKTIKELKAVANEVRKMKTK
jgi:hypothetical protein